MKLTGQLRREKGIPLDLKRDSEYRVRLAWGKQQTGLTFELMFSCSLISFQPIERVEKKFNPLHIPKKLQAALPYASKPKQLKKQSKPTLEQRRAVVMEPHERKVVTLLQQLNTIKNEKAKKRDAAAKEKRKEYLKRKAKEEELSSEKRKKRRIEDLKEKQKKAGVSS